MLTIAVAASTDAMPLGCTQESVCPDVICPCPRNPLRVHAWGPRHLWETVCPGTAQYGQQRVHARWVQDTVYTAPGKGTHSFPKPRDYSLIVNTGTVQNF